MSDTIHVGGGRTFRVSPVTPVLRCRERWRLAERDRRVVEMFLEGMDTADIADALEIDEADAYAALARRPQQKTRL